ncbi:TonB-dependent receptor [Tamlana sp. 2_MG-2023]|uniref:TonB-dependent receptor n=1 Tax=unclassified Tamlana TaxID=2614803 RepID=UPI0026E45CC9|nr:MULTISPECIES: TonB-dependent receptor [unclassified Tamlana]MDO6759015.1 TonB-dependent receptor [Tamlana sp. 2_MG-2023]MDO6789714.1 TonB-dependent receptor [Tamlana sp. 1_MG-2023]
MIKVKCLCFCFILFLSNYIAAQENISSKVIDIKTGLPVIDVSIHVLNSAEGAYTDENGVFILNNLNSKGSVKLSKIGFETLIINIDSIEDIIYLEPKINELKTVVLRSFSSSQLKKVVPDQIYFSKKDIEKMPFILGEKDVIKLIQFTPGVQQASEGQSGFLVRGGNASMNLTLIDDMYLHSTAHLGGLFSVINSDVVQSLEFSKAGFDAAYGGRLSSIIDIKTLKKTDSTNFQGSIGLISSKLTGNIKLNETNSLLLSGRRSYLEALTPFFSEESSILKKGKKYYLYDLLVKHTGLLSEKSSLETVLYNTSDNFTDVTQGRDRKINWGNFLLGTTFSYQFSDILNSQTTFSNSYYKFSVGDKEFPYDYDVKSTFNILGLKHHFLWNKNQSIYKAGLNYNRNTILPKKVNAFVDDSPLEIENEETYIYDDISLFGDIEYPISDKLKTKLGLRLTSYITKSNALIDNEIFLGVEPRVSLRYKLRSSQALKFNYQRITQFVHQASVSSFSFPADFYLVSTKDVKPQVSNQLSLGYVYEVNGMQFNSAVYFKDINNYTEFENGSVNNLFSNNIYSDVLIGNLKSWGIEFSMSNKINKITLQNALTLSKTIAKFDEINDGAYFPAIFDRPINFSSLLNYQLNDRIELGMLFIYTSGQNYTKPLDVRIINEEVILNYGAKNGYRYPSYNRLDLSCTYSFKQKGKWKSKLNLTLYNVYNRKNPFQITYDIDSNSGSSFLQIEEDTESLFPFLPTINWLFSF